MINVVLLGAGNVATHLFKAFTNTEAVTVKQWYNRNLKTIAEYKNKVLQVVKVHFTPAK